MFLIEPIEHSAAALPDDASESRIGPILGFRHDIGHEGISRIGDAVSTLLFRANATHRTQRHRGTAPRALVALEYQYVGSGISSG